MAKKTWKIPSSNRSGNRSGGSNIRPDSGTNIDINGRPDVPNNVKIRQLEARGTLEIEEVLENGNLKVMFNKKGKTKLKEVTPDNLSRITGIPKNDILKKMDDVKVKEAVRLKGGDLKKLGIAGSLGAFVVFLMIITGKANPVDAIAEALKAAAETAADAAADAGGFVFDNLFKGMDGIFNVSAMFLFSSSIALVLWLVISVVLKK